MYQWGTFGAHLHSLTTEKVAGVPNTFRTLAWRTKYSILHAQCCVHVPWTFFSLPNISSLYCSTYLLRMACGRRRLATHFSLSLERNRSQSRAVSHIYRLNSSKASNPGHLQMPQKSHKFRIPGSTADWNHIMHFQSENEVRWIC